MGCIPYRREPSRVVVAQEEAVSFELLWEEEGEKDPDPAGRRRMEGKKERQPLHGDVPIDPKSSNWSDAMYN